MKASHNKDFAITQILVTMLIIGGVYPSICAALADLFDGIKTLTGYVIRVADVEAVQASWDSVFKNLQTVLIPVDRTAALHALYHLPAQVLWYGPSPSLWSYPFEGEFSQWKLMAQKNNATPVQTLTRRLSMLMGLRDLARYVGVPVPGASAGVAPDVVVPDDNGEAKDGKAFLFDALKVSNGPDSMRFEDLVRKYYDTEAGCRAAGGRKDDISKAITYGQVEAREFASIDVVGNIIIQGEDNKRRKTCNEWLFLLPSPITDPDGNADSAATPKKPDIGRVHRIYRVSIGPIDNPIAKRLLLLVARYPARDVDPELQRANLRDRMYCLWDADQPAYELVDVTSIDDQAIQAQDVRKRTDSAGNFHWYLFFTKSRLRNIQLTDPYA